MILLAPKKPKPSRDQNPGAMIQYLTDQTVVKETDTDKYRVFRSPAPETIYGEARRTRDFLSRVPFTRKFSTFIMSADKSDFDVSAFNSGLRREEAGKMIALMLDAAYAGIPTSCRPPIFANTHSHIGRLEINVVLPLAATSSQRALRSFNPFPPRERYRRLKYLLQDTLNYNFKLVDPLCPLRTKLMSLPDWLQKERAESIRRENSADALLNVLDPLLAQAELGLLDGRKDLFDCMEMLFPEIGYLIDKVTPSSV